jgi:hypothetical protein
VQKKDGEIRFCVDFRRLNANVVGDAYPMPFIPDFVDALGNAKVFSTLDLAKGYWQLPLPEKSKQLTAFSTVDGLYEFNVLPFGLCTASASFQRTMNHILGHLPYVRVYMDHIIVFSKNSQEHEYHLVQVLKCLQEAGLTINEKKCRSSSKK